MFQDKIEAPATFLSVGEMARRSGLPVSTLHFYERQGLIRASRSSGNQRRFSRDVLRRIAIIRIAQRLGFPLSNITSLMNVIPEGTQPSAAEVRKMVGGWRTALQVRIDALVELRDHLDRCIGCGCLSQTECPLRNPADQLARQGSGPRALKAALLAADVDD